MNPNIQRTYPYTAYLVSADGTLKTITLIETVPTHCLLDEGSQGRYYDEDDDGRHYDVRQLHLTKAEAIAVAAAAANKEHAKLTDRLAKLATLQTKLILLAL